MPTRSIPGYDDIHANVRYWLTLLTDARRALNGETVLYDIGSNDGEISLPLAAEREGVRVVAFEPQPDARARLIAAALERNLSTALWGAADVSVIPVALGERDATVELVRYSDDTFSSLYPRDDEELRRYDLREVGTATVRMRPLDDLRASSIVPPPSVVKIDVEGAELSVLRGGGETLRRTHPPVVVEFSRPNTANAGYDRLRIVDELASLGYDCVRGLFRNADRCLYGPESFGDERIWNVVAVTRDGDEAVCDAVTRHEGTWHKGPLPPRP